MGRTSTPRPDKRAKRTTARKLPLPSSGWERQRAKLQESLRTAPADGLDPEEISTHFACMPSRYWLRTDKVALRWHLGTIHAFLTGLADPHSSGTSPVVRWRHFPRRGLTEIAVCTWDRLGLLAKVAGALADTGLNIIRAEIYTRTDNLVLDLFQICGTDHRHIADELLLRHVAKLLDASLTVPTHPFSPARKTPSVPPAPPPVVAFDNDRSPECTLLEIEAPDRVGLLHGIFKALADCDTNVAQAVITTDEGQAGDLFYLTDSDGRKIRDHARLETIRHRLLEVL